MKLSETPLLNPKILCYGKPGTGKTAFATTAGAKTQILDMDGGLRTCLTLEDKWTENRRSVDVLSCLETDPKRPTAFSRAKSYIEGVSEDARKGSYKYDLFVLDSLTALTDAAMRTVLANDAKLGTNPQIQHYGLAFNMIENVLMQVKTMPCIVLVIAHDQDAGSEGQGIREIAVPGRKLPAKILSYFDEVLYFKCRPATGSDYRYCIQTKSTSQITARSRFNIKDDIDQAIGLVGLLELMGPKL